MDQDEDTNLAVLIAVCEIQVLAHELLEAYRLGVNINNFDYAKAVKSEIYHRVKDIEDVIYGGPQLR